MSATAPGVPGVVLEVLAEAQLRGYLGAGELGHHVAHSLGFARLAEQVAGIGLSPADSRLADLGSGGGVPGLVMAASLPDVRLRFIEGAARRASFLRWAVERCGLAGRVEVVEQRAEVAAREPRIRGDHRVVVARLFAAPPVTAECGAPLLEVGGVLIVSEPPAELVDDRWPAPALDGLGLVPEDSPLPGYAVLRQVRPCPDRFPRRVGVPTKRPLF